MLCQNNVFSIQVLSFLQVTHKLSNSFLVKMSLILVSFCKLMFLFTEIEMSKQQVSKYLKKGSILLENKVNWQSQVQLIQDSNYLRWNRYSHVRTFKHFHVSFLLGRRVGQLALNIYYLSWRQVKNHQLLESVNYF